MADGPQILKREILSSDELAGVPHGFLTGIGHEGEPDPAVIRAGGELVTVKQVHSALAVLVDAPFAPDDRPQVDAMVTATPGLVLGIVTADCAPILLADREAGIVAAAHAGWRGALGDQRGGVIEATIDLMEQVGADAGRITAAIGPAIAQRSYEVDEGFRSHFRNLDERFFASGVPGHYQFDLEGYVAQRLEERGVTHIDRFALDTYCDAARFHSFRRATHNSEPTYGRQFSLIAISPRSA